MWVFSAETVKSQEVEFIDEHPRDLSMFLLWFARAFLFVLYLFVLLVILNTN